MNPDDLTTFTTTTTTLGEFSVITLDTTAAVERLGVAMGEIRYLDVDEAPDDEPVRRRAIALRGDFNLGAD